MNRKGFTLIELLAVIILLGLVMTITIISVNSQMDTTKNKTEELFIETLKDAIKIYLDTDALKINYNNTPSCSISKSHNDTAISIYRASNNLSFMDIINSSYKPITSDDMVNPSNKKKCNVNAEISIFKDEDYVYYYKIKKSDLECLNDADGYITNLPEGCN